jgi:drug/metabolite transporter (DMT)-like permease
MLFNTVLTQILAATTGQLKAVSEDRIDFNIMKTSILPVTLLYSISLVLANKTYIYLSVSYIQMLKAFTPIAVLILSFTAGLSKTTLTELYIVIIICVGVAMTSVGETYFSWFGFNCQALAIVAESARLVLTNLLLKNLKLDPLSALYYQAPLICVIIGIPMMYFEFDQLPFERMTETSFIVTMLINGLVAFSLNIAVILVLQHTSALTFTLAGIVKDILLVISSVVVFGAPVTPLQYLGYSFSLLGLFLHKQYTANPEKISGLISYMVGCGRIEKEKASKPDGIGIDKA